MHLQCHTVACPSGISAFEWPDNNRRRITHAEALYYAFHVSPKRPIITGERLRILTLFTMRFVFLRNVR